MSAKKQMVREKFRNDVFKRDKFTCKIAGCGIKENLDAHHITDRTLMPNGGYVKENGISLCQEHHMAAELFNISGGKEWLTGMHPEDLYKMIGSSKDAAIEISKKL